ncbi:hypothetical protein JR334_02155 [Clostridia bacterium]|nr:hypothetical protein JR334_02155 [Clostridia bacterium]
MKKQTYAFIFITAIALMLSGCSASSTGDNAEQLATDLEACQQSVTTLEAELAAKDTIVTSLTTKVEDLETSLENRSSTQNVTLLQEALDVMSMIANQDSQGLDTKVSPTRGVRFSPYPYIDTNNDIILYAGSTVPTMFTSSAVQTWGSYSGSGDPITSDFSTYYSGFVYDEDYLNPELIGINTLIGSGNMMNNLETVYANDQYVEFHFTGFDPSVEGLDWGSLILVFDDDNPNWELVGIVHGEWTI